MPNLSNLFLEGGMAFSMWGLRKDMPKLQWLFASEKNLWLEPLSITSRCAGPPPKHVMGGHSTWKTLSGIRWGGRYNWLVNQKKMGWMLVNPRIRVPFFIASTTHKNKSGEVGDGVCLTFRVVSCSFQFFPGSFAVGDTTWVYFVGLVVPATGDAHSLGERREVGRHGSPSLDLSGLSGGQGAGL